MEQNLDGSHQSMVISKKKEHPGCHLISNGEVMKQVGRFSCTGLIQISDGRFDTEMKDRNSKEFS